MLCFFLMLFFMMLTGADALADDHVQFGAHVGSFVGDGLAHCDAYLVRHSKV